METEFKSIENFAGRIRKLRELRDGMTWMQMATWGRFGVTLKLLEFPKSIHE